ncbi:PepSY-associated TM helix domain-containing protein [Roseateles sp. SL47]|nr:PepSY-associated TM helix domain-containing protein [Roseateles sp. SL47]WAC74319.1 PepSY-associated TM helix domain-containing protein [Roseateles sp. SL47]
MSQDVPSSDAGGPAVLSETAPSPPAAPSQSPPPPTVPPATAATPIAPPVTSVVRPSSAKASGARSAWLKTLHQWHWISSALCLIGMLLFAATGITLNHASSIESKPTVVNRQAQVPDALMDLVRVPEPAPPAEPVTPAAAASQGAATPVATKAQPQDHKTTLPTPLRDWLTQTLGRAVDDREAEWSRDEIYLSMPRPGGDAWVRIDRATGEVEFEDTDRGWISYFNDLHKGRHAGVAWSWFIDLFAVACLLFSITGLLILKFHAVSRPSTWPIVGLGFLLPALLALLFMH